MTEPPL